MQKKTKHLKLWRLGLQLQSTPILTHLDIHKPFFVDVDASNIELGATISKRNKDGRRQIAFHSQKITVDEVNFEIHDKKLLDIFDSFQEWHHVLKVAQHPVKVYTDHKNLDYFMMMHLYILEIIVYFIMQTCNIRMHDEFEVQ